MRRPTTLGTRYWDAFRHDVRYAARGIWAKPGFTVTVALTLAVGIGANATMFGVLDRLLLRAPAHIVDPERVVQIHSHWLGSRGNQSSQPYAVYKDFLANVPDFQSVAVSTPTTVIRREYYPLGRGVAASRVAGAQVSPSYFPLLGVRPVLGRFFQDDEAGETNPQKLAVIGYGFWQRHFGGRRDAIGQMLDLGSDRFTVVGVAPKGFTGTELADVEVWIPIAAADGLRFVKGPEWSTVRNSQWLQVFARLKPNATMEHALAQATAVYRAGERERIAQLNGRERWNPDSEVVVFGSIIPGKSLSSFGVSAKSSELKVSKLLGAVALMVLLIACANAANLLLVRAMSRRREIAVRLALGVSRGRLLSQLFIEGVLLALIGAVGALVIAEGGSHFVRTVLLGESAWSGTAIDGRVLVFTGVAAIMTGLLASLAPALQGSTPNLTDALKSGVREGGASRSRTRTALLVGQAALAIVLLTGAGLFVRSLGRVAELSLGVDVDRVLVAHIEHASVGMSNAEAKSLYLRFAERAHEIPGITAAAVSIGSPFGLGWGTRISLSGHPVPVPPRRAPGPSQYAVTPQYFAALGVRPLSGRLFTEADRMGSERVTIINATAAGQYFPGENAVGQCVKFGADSMPCWTVVGVVTNTRRQELVEDPVPMFYRPLDQLTPATTDGTVSFFGYTLLVRTTGDLVATAEQLRRSMQAAAPSVPYAEVQAMRDILARQTRSWRLGASMFSTFGVIALVLAAVGLYGVVVFSIAQRVHEFGVRLALGAQGSDLVRLTIVRGVAPAAAGVLVGLGLALAAGHFVTGLLFHVSPRDPLVLGGVSAVLLLAAVLASLIPALRVTRLDPLIAMRVD